MYLYKSDMMNSQIKLRYIIILLLRRIRYPENSYTVQLFDPKKWYKALPIHNFFRLIMKIHIRIFHVANTFFENILWPQLLSAFVFGACSFMFLFLFFEFNKYFKAIEYRWPCHAWTIHSVYVHSNKNNY